MSYPIEAVEGSVKIALPKYLIQQYKEDPDKNLSEYTDEDLVIALAEDILNRYFNPEYFDLDNIEL